ncbi:MAG: GntR family transcriptional regulator [Oscillospiraceae bacterium]|nr:GntR family transcriptional regulator [Oscillospiraceae bacterium]
MDIILRNETDDPIYKQIIDQVKAQIIAGRLTAGDALPSMRALASQLRISVITTKRAYEELEREGYIENFLGKGCFVKSQNTDFLREETVRQTEELVAQVCKKGRLCGLTAEDLKEMIDLMYSEDNENE